MGTESEILAAARDLLAEKGERAVTMRAVAERVGITATAIYRHYRDKDALLEEIAGEGFKALEARCRAASEASRDPVDRLRRMVLACIDFSLERPEIAFSMFRARRPKARRFPLDFREDPGRVFGLGLAHVEAAMAAKRIRRDDALETTLLLWAQVQGLLGLYRAGRVGPEAEFRRLAIRTIDRLLAALET